jgi:hypothetical protein
VIQAILEKHQEVRNDPNRFERYEDKPREFCREILGIELWEKQIQVLEYARDYPRVAVRSGHGVGKTTAVACLVLWWLYARKGRVISTAPTWEHVEGVLWKEIHLRRSNARVYLPGEAGQTSLTIDRTWYAEGLSTSKPSAFQGRHHPRLLVVIDEAPGVAEQVHLEISTLCTDDTQNTLAMIGNPTLTSGTFYESFKHPNLWKLMAISCYEHPNVVTGNVSIPGAVTRGWVNLKRIEWGEQHPLWFSRVLGDFPRKSERGTIPLGWVEQSIDSERWKEQIKHELTAKTPRVGGLDVARYGGNRTVLTVRRGDVIEFQQAWPNATLTETAGRALMSIKEFDLQLLVVDAAGLGAGVADILMDANAPVQAYNGGHRAFTPSSFTNRRSEMWWYLRQRFEKHRIILPAISSVDRDNLVADLVRPEYEIKPSGKIAVESKEHMLDNSKPSPDYADSLVLAFAMDGDPEEELRQPPAGRQDPMPQIEEEWEELDEGAPFGQLPHGF